jgi:hypothetical protein
MTRRGYSPEHIDAVKDAFKSLYRDNGSTAMNERIEQLRGRHADVPAVLMLCDALDASACGVHGRALESFRNDDKRAPVAADAPMPVPTVLPQAAAASVERRR